MATSLMQRIRLWWRGSQRRRDEKEREFLARNVSWSAKEGVSAPSAPPTDAAPATALADHEGLQAAYLDRSGVILYYLDKETGEVVESRDELSEGRYARVPTQSDEDDQRAFLRTLTLPQRVRFQKVESFRAAVAQDRAIEKAWFNFKNDRATAAIEAWLKTL